jgi:hypothetical protein
VLLFYSSLVHAGNQVTTIYLLHNKMGDITNIPVERAQPRGTAASMPGMPILLQLGTTDHGQGTNKMCDGEQPTDNGTQTNKRLGIKLGTANGMLGTSNGKLGTAMGNWVQRGFNAQQPTGN